MSFLVDLLVALSRPILKAILDMLGYDWDWEPAQPDTKRRSPVLSAVLCLSVVAILTGGLIWLAWLVSR
jgi:hypothetical protein